MIDESLDVKEVVYSAERVSVIHDDELVSTVAPSTGLWGTVVICGEEVKEGGSVQRALIKSFGNESQFSPVPLTAVQANTFWLFRHDCMFVM